MAISKDVSVIQNNIEGYLSGKLEIKDQTIEVAVEKLRKTQEQFEQVRSQVVAAKEQVAKGEAALLELQGMANAYVAMIREIDEKMPNDDNSK